MTKKVASLLAVVTAVLPALLFAYPVFGGGKGWLGQIDEG
jgi:hypothetical protein